MFFKYSIDVNYLVNTNKKGCDNVKLIKMY